MRLHTLIEDEVGEDQKGRYSTVLATTSSWRIPGVPVLVSFSFQPAHRVPHPEAPDIIYRGLLMDRAPVSQQLSALWPSSRSTRADSLDAFKFYNCQWDYYEYLVDYLNSYGCSVSKAMSDYDDLYSNSFTFDEDVEASLQRAESEFFTAQQPRPTLTAPPFKKLKTDHNWASSSNSTHVPQSSQKSQGWRQALREQVKNTKAIGSGQGGGSYSASSNPSPTALSKPQNPPLSQKSSSMSSNDAHTHRSNLRRVSSKTEGDCFARSLAVFTSLSSISIRASSTLHKHSEQHCSGNTSNLFSTDAAATCATQLYTGPTVDGGYISARIFA